VKTWTNLALMALATAGILLVAFGYSRRLGDELLAAAEIDALERIPVLGHEED
jgi:ABC-type glycerol-3-phosphate transport system permease component